MLANISNIKHCQVEVFLAIISKLEENLTLNVLNTIQRLSILYNDIILQNKGFELEF